MVEVFETEEEYEQAISISYVKKAPRMKKQVLIAT